VTSEILSTTLARVQNHSDPGLDLAACAGQVLVVGFPSEGPPAELRALARSGALGGYILFKRNVGTMDEVAALVAELVAGVPAERPLLVAVDQEGGRVARLKAPVLPLPPMLQLASLGDASLVRRAASALGRQLRALGFTMDFAPVLDIDTNPKNPVIGDRAFGRDAATVIEHGLAFSDGLLDAQVLSCGKHFPGHGDTFLDSHLALPRLAHERARLEAMELAPFRAARGRVPSLMTAHIVFEALDPDVPATLSSRVITELLRRELGYDGVVISDDLEMKAVADHYETGDAACRAIAAGCDTVLVCSKPELALVARDALLRRAEQDAPFAARLRDAAARSLAMRRRVPAPAPITDAAALRAALEAPAITAVAAELTARLAAHAAVPPRG
jgi:beta-N-acetylhexosaminidase